MAALLDRLDGLVVVATLTAAADAGGAAVTRRTVSILGATGSVGTSTLDLVERQPDRFEVVALTAATQRRRAWPMRRGGPAPGWR